MEDLWKDPVLLTDVSWQKQSSDSASRLERRSFEATEMADHDGFCLNMIDDVYWEKQNSETLETGISSDRHPFEAIDGRSLLGFSLTSPDLVICAGSPDIPSNVGFNETPKHLKTAGRGNTRAFIELSLEEGIHGSETKGVQGNQATTSALFPEVQTSVGDVFDDTPEHLKNANRRNMRTSMELSLGDGINGSETEGVQENQATMSDLFPEVQTSEGDVLAEASLELPVSSTAQDNSSIPVLSINAGGIDQTVTSAGVDFLEDSFFTGGDVIRTERKIAEDDEFLSLYQTARFGNFSYNFQMLDVGNYLVDLHFAEIIFTDGPPGMRIFDVFIQEEKVLSFIDIYAQVGACKPLVVSDLKAFVSGKEGLSIRFEGVIGSATVCGISIRKDPLAGFRNAEFLKDKEVFPTEECKLLEGECNSCNCEAQGEMWKLRRDYELKNKELMDTKQALKESKWEYELKSKECQEAWLSLQELQNELMRKSMHVGSLAFAIEGQVKEKSRWFSALRELTKKFKILKIEHIKLSEEALEYKKCLADMTQMTSTVQFAMSQHMDLEREHRDLKCKFIEGTKERKELYNKVLEVKGNIRVFCRCRPLSTEEIATGASMTIDFESAKDGELTVKVNGVAKKVFKFDSVFSPQAGQADVFEETAPLATSVLDGYNVCIFAYGQTGTGKTFTMEGTEEARGVNYRTLEELFRIIKDRQALFQYEVSVSVLEVYNEQIRDLLVPGPQPGIAAKRLEIRQVAEGIHHVPGLVEANVNNMNEVWEVLKTGSNARAVGSTNSNEHSSRSHCIHCVMVKGENLMNGECTRSKLWLVDLAGSERIAKADVQGDRLKETQNINRSLSALGDVISALATKSPHIPFRNSKLTHLLQDSLGGDSKTLMFVQISPNENDLSETLCSLNFASRVRGVELGPAKKQLDSSELSKYKQMVEKAKQEMKSKEGYIKKMEETIHSLDLKMKTRDLNNKSLQEKVKELESQLLVERRLARQHVDTKIAEQQQQQQGDHHLGLVKPLLATRPFNQKNVNELPSFAFGKDGTNLIKPLIENNNIKPQTSPLTDTFLKYNSMSDKENKPEISEQLLLPRRTGRASLCPTAQKIPVVSTPRRNSLIPLPTGQNLASLPPSLLPVPPPQVETIKETEACEGDCLEQTPHSPKPQKKGSGTKKLSSILRRSVQKKIYIKSPLQQHIRRAGVNGGMEKLRVSIGGRGRMAHRVLLSNVPRGPKEVQQKQNQKEKERGWNLGTTGRTVL
ncbi:PREDICTED: uncharacterized protein LOC104589468 [Nelumbo nucifera]|uniref:Uncharacterized protein LOC104589468 n=2 Tax=Nelumbo nucifera TaxID=4432 RepID=A0A1U7Z210_NELNU|nr:PREDICTED: uncharacterized protein LOC104589468 [Nelumbo nucifera]DAD37385.1 TPA_asm: hypothetical protein HUJ06_008026 [Nelumbo nucifera]